MIPRRVALTFDAEHPDRPTRPGVVESILDTLERNSVHATFFLQGRWVESYPKIARRIAADGHLIGSHSFYHARMPLLSDSGFETDVRDAERVIRKTCRTDARPLFRCPFGAGYDDPRTHRLLSRLGYRDVNWSVDTGDWRVGMSGPRLARETLDKARNVDDAIVLMHSWPRATARALPLIVQRLLESDARFVGVDELTASS